MSSILKIEQFVTCFDSNFLPQGLALNLSLKRHMGASYKLWVLCLDDKVYEQLVILDQSNIALLRLSDLETSDLTAAKSNRTLREYCWTLTPFTPLFVFQADADINQVTYLDADTWFMKHPRDVFLEFEFSKKDTLITEHAYSIEHDQTKTSGKYCVQFMTFTRRGGEEIRSWWSNKCLEWCHAWFEDDKYGDQKYLEKFPQLFPDKVHIAKNLSAFMAPWNASRFDCKEATMWHFHGLRIIELFGIHRIFFGDYFLSNYVLQGVYSSYAKDLKIALNLMGEANISIPVQAKLNPKEIIKYVLSKYLFIKKLFPYKNIVNA